MSSVTLGSSPPTYKARLFGSGAARRTKLPEPEDGDIMPPESPPGDATAVGIGLVFCGMTTGGSGGGGMCAGLPWPFVVALLYGSCPGAPAKVGGGGSDIERVDGKPFASAIMITWRTEILGQQQRRQKS